MPFLSGIIHENGIQKPASFILVIMMENWLKMKQCLMIGIEASWRKKYVNQPV